MRCSSRLIAAVAALAALLAPGAGFAEAPSAPAPAPTAPAAAPPATPAAPAPRAAALATPPVESAAAPVAPAVPAVETSAAIPQATAAPTPPAPETAAGVVPSGLPLEPVAATSPAVAAPALPAASLPAAPDPAAAGSTALATSALPAPSLPAALDPAAAGSTAVATPALVPATTFPAVLDASGAVPPSGTVPPSAVPPSAAASPSRPGPGATASAKAAPRKPWRTLPLIGLALTGGFPDLATLNLLVRPVDWVRLYAGPSWGYLSWGMQGGVVLSPINWYLTPTLSFQAGKLFQTNASRFLKKDDPDTAGVRPLLERIDYHYYAGDLGLELGSPRGFNFFLRFGLSFVVVKANGTGTNNADDGTRVSISNPRVSAWLPSAKLGFQYWF